MKRPFVHSRKRFMNHHLDKKHSRTVKTKIYNASFNWNVVFNFVKINSKEQINVTHLGKLLTYILEESFSPFVERVESYGRTLLSLWTKVIYHYFVELKLTPPYGINLKYKRRKQLLFQNTIKYGSQASYPIVVNNSHYGI